MTVIEIGNRVKFAVSAIGPFIVTLAGLAVPVYDPVPEPVQLLNTYPPVAEALICTDCPLLYHPLEGLTVPPRSAFIVNKYCVVKFAVYVVGEPGVVIVCDIAPPSLQLLHTYCTPVPPLCGVVVAIV